MRGAVHGLCDLVGREECDMTRKYRTCRDGIVHYGQSFAIVDLVDSIGLPCEKLLVVRALGESVVLVGDEAEVDCMTCLAKRALLETWLYVHNQRPGG